MDSTDDKGGFPVKPSSDTNSRIRLGDAMINRPQICAFAANVSTDSAKGQIKDRTFEIEFLDPGAQAFSFTFG